ncbi:hypothetical protein AB0903_10260 [Streptomyces sp. NPDC048389]|uniref:hypothetical protein n=1 Tax=Streptomyces sp. NPDC048389 TaxID=3154622 RepID=UPI0034525BB4
MPPPIAKNDVWTIRGAPDRFVPEVQGDEPGDQAQREKQVAEATPNRHRRISGASVVLPARNSRTCGRP